jgi:hypothetical protein
VKGQRPRPLDDGGKCLLVKGTRLKHTGKQPLQAKSGSPMGRCKSGIFSTKRQFFRPELLDRHRAGR